MTVAFFPESDNLEQSRIKRILSSNNFDCVEHERIEPHMYGVRFSFADESELVRACDMCGVQYLSHSVGPVGDSSPHVDLWINYTGGPQKRGNLLVVGSTPEQPHPVQFHTRPGRSKDAWRGPIMVAAHKLLVSFSKTVDRPVTLMVNHVEIAEKAVDPENNVFTIHIWSTHPGNPHKRGAGRVSFPKNIWTYGVGCRDDPFLPAGDGIAIVDDKTGWCVAELFAHDLYVHHDLCECDTDREIGIFKRLLEEVLMYMSVDVTGEAIAERFVRLCTNSHTRVVALTRNQIAEDTALVAELDAKRKRAQGRIDGRKAKLRQLEASPPDEAEFAANFVALTEHPAVTRVGVQHGVILVETRSLFCQDPNTGVIHRLGQQELTVHPDGKNGGVRFKCLDGNISGTGLAIPHSNKDGSCSHVEALEPITELIALRRYHEVVDVALQAATTIDPEDSRSKVVVKWPHATPAELVGTEWEGQQVAAPRAA